MFIMNTARFFIATALLSMVGLLVSCAAAGPAVAPVTDVAFFATDAAQARGRLYDPRSSDRFGGKETGPAVFGLLILDGLKGWTTSEPVPSFSYWRNKKGRETFESPPSAAVYGYWTGEKGALCEIPVWVTIQDFQGGVPEPEKLRLEYRNPNLIDHVILGAEAAEDKALFAAAYDGSPLEILGVEIIEAEGVKGGFSISHGVIIRSGLKPSQEDPTGSSGDR